MSSCAAFSSLLLELWMERQNRVSHSVCSRFSVPLLGSACTCAKNTCKPGASSLGICSWHRGATRVRKSWGESGGEVFVATL